MSVKLDPTNPPRPGDLIGAPSMNDNESLAVLAALAVERVPEFDRPRRVCRTCGGTGEAHQGFESNRCDCEAGPGFEWDNSPEALLMAAAMKSVWVMLAHDVGTPRTPETIARGALKSLLLPYSGADAELVVDDGSNPR